MIGTKAIIKQNSGSSVSIKNHNIEPKSSHNSCGGCNSCHQMTGIHSMTNSPVFGGSGDGDEGLNLQRSCATNFFQRNLGNSYMQSIAENRQAPGSYISGSGVPTIQRKCSCGGSCSSCSGKEEELNGIQTKLTIGSPNDVYEQEADRVAEQIMWMPEPSIQSEKHTNTGIKVQKLSSYDGGATVSDQDIKLNQSGGRPLTPSTRNFMEPRFGADFGHVRLHTDQDAHKTASQIQAKAFTYGSHIWFGKGESEKSGNLMAHELTHVLQQGAALAEDQTSFADVTKNMAVPQVQLARLECTTRKKIDVYPVNLPGSTRSISDDIATINSVLCQCGIEINALTGQSVETNVLDLDPPVGSLNYSDATPSRELSQLLQIRPGGNNMIHAYYVPAISSGLFGTSVSSTRFSPSLPDSLIVTNRAGAVPIVAAHELVHVLLDDGSHHPNRDNLMANRSINSGAGELEQPQCNRMP